MCRGVIWSAQDEKTTYTGISVGHKLRRFSGVSEVPEAIFTPSTKAEEGHDENITEDQVRELIGDEQTALLRDTSLRLFSEAHDYARQRGIIIADTKFEFGLDKNGELLLVDEVLTPDSSRFWPADEYKPGRSRPCWTDSLCATIWKRSIRQEAACTSYPC